MSSAGIQSTEGIPPAPLTPAPWCVIERHDETDDCFTLKIAPSMETPRMDFLPGQFNMLYAFGTGESAISISGDPGTADGSLIHTIRRVGNVTSALSRLQPGDTVGVRGPFGTTWPMGEARGKDLVFLAGGIGLAPLRPAIYHALAHREDYGRIVILTGARTPEEVIFAKEQDEWRKVEGLETKLTVDRATDGWSRSVGVVTTLVSKVSFDPDNAVAMLCGPEVMMRYSAIELRKHGLTDDRIFITMERNMKCAVAFCGHCQLGPEFICKDGPVYSFEKIQFWFGQREV